MRYWIIAISTLLYAALPAPVEAQVGIAFQSDDVSIGINIPVYPTLVSIPGYPVYYNPRGDSNYFFYDGMYWVFQNDNWYASSWYNGPWDEVGPRVRAGVDFARPRALLPSSAFLLQRLGH